MAVVLALLSALSYGAGDFAGGLASRRIPALAVVATSQVIGFAFLGVIALVDGGQPTGVDLAWGVLAGLSGGGALVMLFHSFTLTRLSVASPVAALVSAGVPVAAGVVLGERPTALAWFGTAIALPAIVVISASGGGHRRETDRHGVVFAIGAGIGFGLFFIFADRITEAAGTWPLVSARGASLIGLWSLLILGSHVPRLDELRDVRGQIAIVGVLDAGANLFALLALQRGLLSLVGVIVALYPAVTVALAAIVLGEHIDRRQRIGLTAAAASVVLIAA